MNEGIAIVIVIGILTYSIIALVKLILDFKLKKRLIDKAEVNENFSNALEESMKTISSSYERNRYPTLKWGLVFLFAGIGLISLEYLQYEFRSPLPFGIILACTSLGFLIYYLIMRNEMKKSV